jgi:hypothetical protein
MKDVKKQLEKLLVRSIVVRVAVDGPLQIIPVKVCEIRNRRKTSKGAVILIDLLFVIV